MLPLVSFRTYYSSTRQTTDDVMVVIKRQFFYIIKCFVNSYTFIIYSPLASYLLERHIMAYIILSPPPFPLQGKHNELGKTRCSSSPQFVNW